MAVHRVHEFFVHIGESELTDKQNVEQARQFVESEGHDFELEDDITIETFTSESEAEQMKKDVLAILSK